MPKKVLIAIGSIALLMITGRPAWAHVFPDHSQPEVGSTLDHSPKNVRIWFGGTLEKVFSHLRVDNAQGQQVNKGDGNVTGEDDRLLEADVPPLSPGTYHVYWSVVARDGHRTMGDFTFTVKGD